MAEGADPRAEKRVGTVLNEKWTLEQLLGAGGMGAVYSARHRNGARAAVKLLHPELARMPEVRERFLREGYAANRVEHRGAVQVLDDDVIKDGPDEGSAYLVMELLEGESLQDRVNRSPKLGETELLEVMDAVLDVLGAAHEHGVVHRDLKPENIFLAHDLEREGVRVKVLDFGLARISEASTVTVAGIAVGTPSFMSPEQAAGRGDEIDGRTDIFALGATIFRIVTGRRIHDADNMVQLVTLMATVPAPPIRSVVPNVSEAFARIIDRALAFERNDRYPDAAAMRADIRAVLTGAARASAANLLVIPFSSRGRPGSNADATTDVLPAIRPKADTNAALASDGDRVTREERPRGARAPSPPAQSSTLPWAIVLVLLAIGAWKLGPSIQAELVRRASIEPVRKLWPAASASASAEPSDPGEPSPLASPTGEVSKLTPPALVFDADAAAEEIDAGVDDVEDEDAGATLEELVDAGTTPILPTPPATTAKPAVHPHPIPTPHPTAKPPPPKKPPPKKGPVRSQPRHR